MQIPLLTCISGVSSMWGFQCFAIVQQQNMNVSNSILFTCIFEQCLSISCYKSRHSPIPSKEANQSSSVSHNAVCPNYVKCLV